MPFSFLVLDAGCGTGNYLHALTSDVHTIVGMDFNLGMLEQNMMKVQKTDSVILQQGSITEMPFAADTFDAVMMNQVHIQ